MTTKTNRSAPDERIRGVRDTPTGRQAYIRVNGQFYSKVFPFSEPLTRIKEWRERRRAAAKYGIGDDETIDRTFRDEAREYLTLVKGMPSYSDREYHIGQWIDVFGPRRRAKITSREIIAALERWRVKGGHDRPLSHGSLNRRRTALMAMFTKLDGKSAANIVKDVPPYSEHASETIRAIPLPTAYRLLARTRKGSKTRARLRVLLWTGWPHTQIAKLRPEHLKLDDENPSAFVTRRAKGKGHAGKWLPLVPPAVTALREFIKVGAFVTDPKKPFSNDSIRKSFLLAWQKENAHRARLKLPPLPKVRPYDLRHTFGTWLAARSTDERAVMELMLHSKPQQTRRYTEAATGPRVEAAVAAIRLAMAGRATNATPQTGSDGVARARRTKKQAVPVRKKSA